MPPTVSVTPFPIPLCTCYNACARSPSTASTCRFLGMNPALPHPRASLSKHMSQRSLKTDAVESVQICRIDAVTWAGCGAAALPE